MNLFSQNFSLFLRISSESIKQNDTLNPYIYADFSFLGEGLSSGRMTSGATICEVTNVRECKQKTQGQRVFKTL